MKFGCRARMTTIVGAATFAALIASAPSALADPVAPPPVPLPAPVVAPDSAPPLPAPDAAAPLAVAPEGIPHLASPENLPPGTSVTPTPQTRFGYLRDLWHAMQTQEVSGSDALLLLTQRPMSSAPSPGMPAGPQPVAPVAP